MSTEVLDRSMDLVHEKRGTVHHLTFDSSYPSKIRGCVIKLFKATAQYNVGDTFMLHLDDDEVLNINTISSFDGQLTIENRFKENDMVICVIDVTEDRDAGEIKIWDISKEYSVKAEAMIFEYDCNGVNDSYIINGIINELQTLDDDAEDVVLDEYGNGINISKTMRGTTRQIIFKLKGQFGLDSENTWEKFTNVARETRIEFIHIDSNNTYKYNSNINREDLFSFVFDFEECIILQDAKEAIEHSLSTHTAITKENWGPRAYLFGFSGNSSCKCIIKNLRFCKDYMGLAFVDGKDKIVDLQNCTLITNTFGGTIAPLMYASSWCIGVNDRDKCILADTYNLSYVKVCGLYSRENVVYSEEKFSNAQQYYKPKNYNTQRYSKNIRFPVYIDNYSESSIVYLHNTDINPNNDGYSAIPHVIQNSGKISIDSSNFNFYDCIKYYDYNTFETQSGAIYNIPKGIIDDNDKEYKQMDYIKSMYSYPEGTDSSTSSIVYHGRPELLGTWRDFRKSSGGGIVYEDAFDHIGYWSGITVNKNSFMPTVEISNSNIKHTRNTFISNLHGIVKVYNSKLEIINRKTVYYNYSTSLNGYGKEYLPFYASGLQNRIIDSYGGELHVKDNTIIIDGLNIQGICMSPAKHSDANSKCGTISCVNNAFEMKFDYSEILYPSICVKSMGYTEANLDSNVSSNFGNKIHLQNCSVKCNYTGSMDEFKTTDSYSEAIETALDKLGIENENAKYIAMYMHFMNIVEKNSVADLGWRDSSATFNLKKLVGTCMLYNIGDNYVTIENCYTDKINKDVSGSPIIGIYDVSVNNSGKLVLDNCDIGSWVSCVTSVLRKDLYDNILFRNSAFAHNVRISNSRFANFFDYTNKNADEDRQMIFPIIYLETNLDIDLDGNYFNGGDIVINTDSSSKVSIDNCDFVKAKALFNVYKDFIEIGSNGNTYNVNNLMSCYNMVNIRSKNRHSRMSKDSLTITNSRFNGTINTKLRHTIEDMFDEHATKDCVNKANIAINSINKVTIRDCEFESEGNNIVYYGQQAALQEFHYFSEENQKVSPYFDFDVFLNNNTFKSIITTKDTINKYYTDNGMDKHYIAANVLLLGDTVNLTARDNTFVMGACDGGCNILSLTDEMFHRYYDGSINNLSDTLAAARIKTAKNYVKLYNNEFASFLVGFKAYFGSASAWIPVDMDDMYYYMYKSHLKATASKYNPEVETTDSTSYDYRIYRAIYRAFNLGIKTCNPILDIKDNFFTKSRGKNAGREAGDYFGLLKTYAKSDDTNHLFGPLSDSDNDIFSGYGICIESTTTDINGVVYSVTGDIVNNIMGSYNTTDDGNVLSDLFIRLNMQGMILRNKDIGSADDPYLLAYTSDFMVSTEDDISKTITDGGTTVFDIKCSGNTTIVDNPGYNDYSCGCYSFVLSNKTVYK